MKKVQTTGTIRQRGQITIPDAILRHAKWASTNTIVTISLTNTDEIRIKPYQENGLNASNWDMIWTRIQAARSLQGKKVLFPPMLWKTARVDDKKYKYS